MCGWLAANRCNTDFIWPEWSIVHRIARANTTDMDKRIDALAYKMW